MARVSDSDARLTILGCGFLGRALARRALDARKHVVGTVRTADDARALESLGVEAHAVGSLAADAVRDLVRGGDLVVAYPPDGATDARLTAVDLRARRIVYVSSTGVYGDARGDVDEATPEAPDAARGRARLEAESRWRSRGAIAIRAAGIYGPGRGIHQRLANAAFRIPGDGANTVSRIHVDDLAALIECALARAKPGSVYVAADDAPVPQIEAVRFVCALLGIAEPPHVAIEDASETLRHDRHVRNARAKRDLGWVLRYPSYREGFRAVMEADGLIPVDQ
jgi:nucleoside-diphosphate-sugar epimerase